jgi:hypothetical protein
MITRDHFKPAYPASRRLTPAQLAEVASLAPQEEPRAARVVTYPYPEGPSRLGTDPVAPYGEDPTDPTTQPQARVQSTGMVGRLHP